MYRVTVVLCRSVVVVAASAAVALAGFASTAVADGSLPITVEYQGSVDQTELIATTADRRIHVQWDFVWDVHSPLVVPSWRIKELTGTVSTVVPPPNQSASCSGTLSNSTRLPALSYQYDPTVRAGSDKPDIVVVSGHAPGVQLSSSGPTPFNFCAYDGGEFHWDEPSPQPNPDPTQATFEYKLGSGTRTEPFNEDWTDPSGRPGARHFVLKSTLTVNGSKPALPKTPKAVRDAALDALRGTADLALYPCLTATTGVVLFSSGTAIGVVAGGTMVAIAAPACANFVAQFLNLQKTYHDPPVAGYRKAAKVVRRPARRVTMPPCSGSAAATCRTLQRLAAAWVTATQRGRESSAALATTVGRESAAVTAHDKSAQALQARTALKLLPTLKRDMGAQKSAGKALAAFMRRNSITGAMTQEQAGKAVDDLVGRLGFARSDLEAEAPSQLKPRPLDLLTVLAQ